MLLLIFKSIYYKKKNKKQEVKVTKIALQSLIWLQNHLNVNKHQLIKIYHNFYNKNTKQKYIFVN